jgi:hypothetical protein
MATGMDKSTTSTGEEHHLNELYINKDAGKNDRPPSTSNSN